MKNALLILTFLSTLSISTFAMENPSVKPCKSETVRFTEADFQVQSLRYRAERPGLKTLLLIPPTGGTNFIDRGYAEKFCENGFDVYILDHWTGDNEYNLDLEIHQRFYARVQRGIGLILANVSSSFIGILGTSVGGIHTAVAMGLHDRLDAAFVIVGGAPLAEIIVNSDQDVLVEAKKKRYQVFHFSNDQEYIDSLDRAFALDPLKLPRRFVGKPLGMVISSNDLTVPTKNQRDLEKFWQPQITYVRSTSHTSTVVRTWLFDKDKIIDFFQNAAESAVAKVE
jgi:dienelactone hydrolase